MANDWLDEAEKVENPFTDTHKHTRSPCCCPPRVSGLEVLLHGYKFQINRADVTGCVVQCGRGGGGREGFEGNGVSRAVLFSVQTKFGLSLGDLWEEEEEGDGD